MQEVRGSLRPSVPGSNSNIHNFQFDDDPVSKDLRAAQVHGQLHIDEMIRKPTRLDALPSVSNKKSRKKRNGQEYY